jgi:hypothetical protein
MWYSPAAHDERELASLSETVIPVEADRHTTEHDDLESGAPSVSAKVLVRSKANTASTGPGSEHWLP